MLVSVQQKSQSYYMSLCAHMAVGKLILYKSDIWLNNSLIIKYHVEQEEVKKLITWSAAVKYVWKTDWRNAVVYSF